MWRWRRHPRSQCAGSGGNCVPGAADQGQGCKQHRTHQQHQIPCPNAREQRAGNHRPRQSTQGRPEHDHREQSLTTFRVEGIRRVRPELGSQQQRDDADPDVVGETNVKPTSTQQVEYQQVGDKEDRNPACQLALAGAAKHIAVEWHPDQQNPRDGGIRITLHCRGSVDQQQRFAQSLQNVIGHQDEEGQ